MRNPYRPPAAAVADLPDAGAAVRPLGVRRAVQLLWVTMAIGLVLGVIDVIEFFRSSPDDGMNLGVTIGAFGIVVGITFWIYGAVYAGRNWARIVVLLFTIAWTIILIGIFVLLLGWEPQLPADAKREIVINTVQFSITLVATALLFTPSANRWYRAVREARH